ncbi:MAG TPA: DUF2752 domain-containing protein [Planctomycetaceae bacterium]|nr:DUF2752 domain-containing protein [Planctomycetaceae bacterium]
MNAIDSQAAGTPVGWRGRSWLTAIGIFLLLGFLLAAWLPPDPRGFGTHQRLGLPPCTMKMLFNRPCPGCGMTTCFAHFVRGQFGDAARANPAGLLIAVSCAGLMLWCWASAAAGRLLGIGDPWPPLAVLLASWGFVGLLVWIVRWWA